MMNNAQVHFTLYGMKWIENRLNIKEGIQDIYINMKIPLKLLKFFCDSHFVLQTVDEIYKVASISLSPNVPAQIFVS